MKQLKRNAWLFLTVAAVAPWASAQVVAVALDDTAAGAPLVAVLNETQLGQSFEKASDEDWFRFAVRKDAFYEITVRQVGAEADPVLTIYGFDPTTVDIVIDDGIKGGDEIYSFQATDDGIFYARVNNFTAADGGVGLDYTLAVFEPIGAFAGPDLAVAHTATYLNVHQDNQFLLDVDVVNNGGQLLDNTATNVLLQVYLPDGVSVLQDPDPDCTVDGDVIICELPDIPDQGVSEIDLMLSGSNLGRRSVVSTVASFDDPERTSLQADDVFSNNTGETEYTVIERTNFGLNSRANQEDFQFLDEFVYYLITSTNEADAALGPVDIYITATGEDGIPVYIADLDLNLSGTPVSVLPNWVPITVPDTEVFRLVLPDTVPAGTYTWSTIFNRAGTDVTDSANHLSRSDFVHQLTN